MPHDLHRTRRIKMFIKLFRRQGFSESPGPWECHPAEGPSCTEHAVRTLIKTEASGKRNPPGDWQGFTATALGNRKPAESSGPSTRPPVKRPANVEVVPVAGSMARIALLP